MRKATYTYHCETCKEVITGPQFNMREPAIIEGGYKRMAKRDDYMMNFCSGDCIAQWFETESNFDEKIPLNYKVAY